MHLVTLSSFTLSTTTLHGGINQNLQAQAHESTANYITRDRLTESGKTRVKFDLFSIILLKNEDPHPASFVPADITNSNKLIYSGAVGYLD